MRESQRALVPVTPSTAMVEQAPEFTPEIQDVRQDGSRVTVLPPDTTDELLIELWLHQRSPQTERAYRADIQLFRAFVGFMPLGETSLLDLQAFANSLDFLAPASQARRINVVKSLFSFAYTTGYLAVNAAKLLRAPTVEDTRAERILSEEQVMRLIALEPNPRNHALLRLLYVGGLRAAEACDLTWERLIPREQRGQIRIVGKGHKTRNVLLSADTWNELVTLRGDAPATAPLFVSRGAQGVRSGGPLTTTQVYRIVVAAARRAGIEGQVSPHWLRHAHASHALDRGAPAHLVRETLGHSSLVVTSRYSHARPTTSSAEYLPL